ncbi:cupin domain-containing protein [Chitinophaga nivalis]|uniref:Cupin domain-containing protein n=1 Tax=Chitinophaga nivalis TaxID=2991709 RepID=A0ABT3IK63_9BACT|nr:cupin domain-containing protein [Chitinophaga nivalis]MCW3465959.1 cupin domain-containing protein [Chitinophaga nivalis]MCW3484350.1 cupin domain-containing protein [Chitinophaga nivalis]
MTYTENKHLITVDANDGPCISVVGDTYRIILGGTDTQGAFATFDMLIPPGGGPPPHAHAAVEESFYVVEGAIEFRSEAGAYTAGKGAFVHIPKGGMVHSFRNNTTEVARLLCRVAPAGLDVLFNEIGTPVEFGQFLPAPQIDQASMEKLIILAGKYGQEIFPPDFLD